MITVKHVMDENSTEGVETVIPAPYGCYFSKGFLWIYDAKPREGLGAPVSRIWGGRAYVMNDSGQTVATYHLRTLVERTGEAA